MLLLRYRRYLSLITGIIVLIFSGCQKAAVNDDRTQERIMEMYREYAKEFPLVESISVAELQQRQQELVLVDVRSPEEIEVSYIPGAITKDKFEEDLNRYRNATVVVYCTIGYRSGKYAQQLRQQGIEVLNLPGSLLAWSHAGGKLVDREGATKQVHVYGRQWQLTPKGYEPVW